MKTIYELSILNFCKRTQSVVLLSIFLLRNISDPNSVVFTHQWSQKKFKIKFLHYSKKIFLKAYCKKFTVKQNVIRIVHVVLRKLT